MLKTNDNVLKQYLQTYLNKKVDLITDDDLEKIDTVYVDTKTLKGFENKIDFETLNKLKNVKTMTISNSIITKDFNKILSHVENLTINFSTFEDEEYFVYLKGLKSITLNKCYIDSYDKLCDNLRNIDHLEVKHPYDINEIDVAKISKTATIIVLDGCKIKNISSLSENHKCKCLSILDSNVNESLEFLAEMDSLKNIYVSKEIISDEIYENLLKMNKEVHFDLVNMTFDDIDDINIRK